jgi:hypothetical protein
LDCVSSGAVERYVTAIRVADVPTLQAFGLQLFDAASDTRIQRDDKVELAEIQASMSAER